MKSLFHRVLRRDGLARLTPRARPWPVVALAFLTLLALGLRIGFALDAPGSQPPDALAYERIAENLSRDGSFDARPAGEGQELQPSSAYSPGLPLFAAAVYELSGGAHTTLALLLIALLGAATVPLTYALGSRLGGWRAGLIGAAAIAIYPALLEYHGFLLTEPLAAFLLIAALNALFRAADAVASLWWWACAGVLLAALSLVRPEYLVVSLVLPVAWLAWQAFHGAFRSALPGLAVCILATALAIAPWTARNAVALDRFVPISTGGGKALFIGTYLEADGDGPKLRELLLDQRPVLRRRLERGGPVNEPERLILERVLARVAEQSHPELSTDAALGRLGRENLEDGISSHTGEFAVLLADKAFHTWTDAPRASMRRLPWRALQLALLLLGLVGLAVVALRRRFEALVLGAILLYVTAVGAVLISSPRRELVVLPILAALAGAGATACADSLARWRR